MTKAGKKAITVLLTVAMAVTLISAFATDKTYAADDDSYRLTIGSKILSDHYNSSDPCTVRYGNNGEYSWRVIGYDGGGVAGSNGTMTLLAADTMGETPFKLFTGYGNDYAGSLLREKVEEIAGHLSEAEQSAVAKRTLLAGEYNHSNPTEVDCISGDPVEDAIMWPLSIKELTQVNNTVRKANSSDDWWLRSQGNDPLYAAKYYKRYNDYAVDLVSDTCGVRPAFHLDLES